MANNHSGTWQYFRVFSEIVSAARYRGTVTYQELADLIGLQTQGNYMANEIGEILDEINTDEEKLTHPILSAIVVDVDGEVGKGFYNWAIKHNKFQDDGGKEKRERFWKIETHRVYDVWKRKF
jgi:hypothetical protein